MELQAASCQAHQKRLGITNSFCAENVQEDHCWAALDKSPKRIRTFPPSMHIRREKLNLRPSFWQLILASRHPHRSTRQTRSFRAWCAVTSRLERIVHFARDKTEHVLSSEHALCGFRVTFFGSKVIGKGLISVSVNACSALDKERWKQN